MFWRGSKAFATEEVERFTFRMPGQAVSYFDGFTRLLEIRQAAEARAGKALALAREKFETEFCEKILDKATREAAAQKIKPEPERAGCALSRYARRRRARFERHEH